MPELTTQGRGAQRVEPPRLAIGASIGTYEVGKTLRGIMNARAICFANAPMQLSMCALSHGDSNARLVSTSISPIDGTASSSFYGELSGEI